MEQSHCERQGMRAENVCLNTLIGKRRITRIPAVDSAVSTLYYTIKRIT